MNNWRLLLLAVVAVFQPIASFTESNLIDGRHQCCDRLSSPAFQDTRSLLHGTYKLDQTTSELRHELKERDSIFERTERRVVQERSASQGPSVEARSTRVEYQLVRIAGDQSRTRLLDIHERQRTTRKYRDLKPRDLTHRVVDRISRDALEHRYDRAYTESSRDSLSRNDVRADRFSERLSKNLFDAQRQNQREQSRSRELGFRLNRDARRTNRDAARMEIEDIDNIPHVSKERFTVLRREFSVRSDTRRNFDNNNERRDLERNSDQRRLLSKTRLVDRIRDIIRLNSREENQEYRQRVSINQQLSTDSVEERREQRELRQQNKENTNRRLTGERMQMARKTRESRIMNERNTRYEKTIVGRREIRNNERMSIERPDEFRENADQRVSHEMIQIDRRNTRGARILTTRNEKANERREIRNTERMSMETRDELSEIPDQRLSRERIQIDRRDTRGNRIINTHNGRENYERREIRNILDSRDKLRKIPDLRLSRERVQVDQRNIREDRILNIRNERDSDDRREIRQNSRTSVETQNQIDRRNTRIESRVVGRRVNSQNERMIIKTRDQLSNNPDRNLSYERVQIVQINTREVEIKNNQNERVVDERQKMSHSSRMFRDTRDEREHNVNRLTLDRAQMNRRNVRNFRVMNKMITQNDNGIDSRTEISKNDRILRFTRDEIRKIYDLKLRDVESRQQIRYTDERTTEIREDSDDRLSRERIQVYRRNIRGIKFNSRNERDFESRREIRYDERLSTETRENLEGRRSRDGIQTDRRNNREPGIMNKENSETRLSRERIQVDRRNIREFTRMNTPNRKDGESQQEIRFNEALTTDTRDKVRITDQRLIRQSRQTDRRDIRESRTINSMATRNERDNENRREIRFNERLSGHIRSDHFIKERRVPSRSLDRIIAAERENAENKRRVRSVERRNFREIRTAPTIRRSNELERRSEAFLSRVEHRNKIENGERRAIDTRVRNVDSARHHDRITSEMIGKMETENSSIIGNWQYVLYTLQAAYLCALFTQMLTPSRTEKSKMSIRWLPKSSHYNPIKVD